MPTANEPIPDFDDVQLGPSSAPVEEDIFAFTVPTKKSKKKKGKKNVEASYRPVEEEDAPTFAEEITPAMPEPDDDPVRDGRYEDEPVPSLLDYAEPMFENEQVTPEPEYADPPRRPSAPPAPQPPASQPSATSPRPSPHAAAAKPVATPYSPQNRAASLYTPPQQYAMPVHRPLTATTAPRRESSTSHTSPRPRFVEPVAPPHMAQPHFYALPDLGLGFGQKKEQAGKAAGSDGYCCSFGTLADAGDAASSRKAKTALLVGSEGGLEVFRVLPNKFEVLGRLEGLRGSVIGAKILPHTDLHDSVQAARPLVAVIVHGVMCDEQRDNEKDLDMKKRPTRYQTTVEVYSLQNQQHVSTLYKTASVGVEQPAFGQLSTLPGPIGDLSIDAHGRFVVLASGKSGEIFVFSQAATAANLNHEFRCIGKFWTSLQRPFDNGSRPQSSSDGGYAVDESDEKPGVPLFSLSQRWLAYVAPSTSSHVPIQGSPLLLEDNPNPPGLASHLAPPQPPISCDVAGVDAEGAWSRLTRQAAQGLVKYSQKGIDMGLQGWKELTNPTTQSGQPHGRSSSGDDRFPPTKAPLDDLRRVAREPAIVSIVDLETLLDAEEQKPKYSPPPLATSALEEECNFLSISSSGLRLLTVSRKGEMSTIWDLTQSSHGVVKHDAAQDGENEHGPCVKQLQRIPRSSQSVVVDCAWTRDDEYLAVLTTHGTVHLHEVLLRPTRKRRRRGTITAPVPMEKAEPSVSVSPGLSPPSSNGFLGSIKSGWQQMSTQVTAVRSQNPGSTFGIPTSFAGFKETAANAGNAGRRALAKSLSQGYSAAKSGASEYWHSEDNKIRHKALAEQAGPGSLRWVKRQSGTLLAVACGGTVHLHPVQRIERRSGDAMVSGLKHDKYGKKHFDLPPIRTSALTNGSRSTKDEGCASEGPHGFWSLRLSPGPAERRASGVGSKALPSQAYEVETNPPYCPIHIDPRVNICAFDDGMTSSQINLLDEPSIPVFHIQGHGLESEEPWLFGESLPPSTKVNTHERIEVDEFHQGITDSDMEDAAAQVESRLTVMSVVDAAGDTTVHTRPVQAKDGGSGQEEDDFESMDDDDSSAM